MTDAPLGAQHARLDDRLPAFSTGFSENQNAGSPRRAAGLPLPLAVVSLLLLLVLGPAACAGGRVASEHVAGKVERAYAPGDVAQNRQAVFPSFVKADMRDGYDYAVNHPDQLQYIPCYCGCGLTADHKNNLDCYIGGVDEDGRVVFDNHASFCSICLEITSDVKRMSAEGTSLKEIRTYVDQTHGEKGPGTDTPLPPL